MQLTLTSFLIGLAFGQLVMGPLSDRFGRRPPLVASAAVCVVAGVVCAMAPTCRSSSRPGWCRASPAPGGMVIGRAVISDLVTGRAAARAFTLMLTVGGVAPVLAPLVGGLLAGPVGWRGMLWAVTGLCLAMLVGVVLVVPRRRIRRRPDRPPRFRRRGAPHSSCHTRGYWGRRRSSRSRSAVMMAYISASPFVYQNVVGLSEVRYGLAFGINAVGLISAGWVTSRLVERTGPAAHRAAAIAMQVARRWPSWPRWCCSMPRRGPTPSPIFVAVLATAAIMGNSAALAMAEVRRGRRARAARSSASPSSRSAPWSRRWSGLGGEDSAVVPAMVMASCSALGGSR